MEPDPDYTGVGKRHFTWRQSRQRSLMRSFSVFTYFYFCSRFLFGNLIMQIVLNEKTVEIAASTTLLQLRQQTDPAADVIVFNGAVTTRDCQLQPGDNIIYLQRGKAPRQDEYDSLMMARHTPAVHNKLKVASVGIAGAGGLGSAVAVALTRAGIGKLIIADFDVVEPSNLQRQQYFYDQIGMPKVIALKENLLRINPFTTIRSEQQYLDHNNIPELFADVDVMVEAFDCPETKALLIQLWLRQFPHTPLVAASGMAGYGFSNTICTKKRMGKLYLCGDDTSDIADGISLMAPRVGIAAHHQANTVIRLLLGIEPIEEEI